LRRYVRSIVAEDIELPNEAVSIAGKYVGAPVGAWQPQTN
jgi:hypothetical protein